MYSKKIALFQPYQNELTAFGLRSAAIVNYLPGEYDKDRQNTTQVRDEG